MRSQWKVATEIFEIIDKIAEVVLQNMRYENNSSSKTGKSSKLLPQVYDKHGREQYLGKHINSGGEGDIIALAQHSHIVVKIYKEEKLKRLGNQLHGKIEAQVSMKKQFQNTNIAWPQLQVFDWSGNFIGYAMRRAKGIPLSKLAHPKLQEKYFPHYTRVNLVHVLLSIIESIEILHYNNIFLGDINLENFLVDDTSDSVYLIDTDSYQVYYNRRFYPCPVDRPEMTPVEHHDQPYEKVVRTRESDLFSLAILFFQVLMLGRHPYDQIGGTNPVENLKSGNFPYGKGSKPPGKQGAIPPGPWYIIWSHLSYNIKGLFIQCFKEGVFDIKKRPRLHEWKEAFIYYLNNLQKGNSDKKIQPHYPKLQNKY